MKRTLVCDNSADVVPDRADSYAPDGAGKFRRVTSQLSAQGSSSLFITAQDMGKWLVNFEKGKVGGRAAIEMMRTPGKLNSGAAVDYGFGLELGDYHGSPMLHHGGGWAGYRSVVMWIPEKRFALAILANAANLRTYELGRKIADLYLDEQPARPSTQSPSKPRVAVKADPATWEAFLGTYRLGPSWLLTITREGDQFMAQATREDKFKMTPTSDNAFFVEAYGAAVEFVREPGGAVTHLLYRGINAPKVNMPEIAPANLAAYAGDYWSEELRVVGRIEIHDGKLATRQTSGSWIYFVPSGADRFDSDAGGLVLEFTRGSTSEVTGASLSGGRVRHIRCTRVTLPQGRLPQASSGQQPDSVSALWR
jgi:hypothetical protein